MIINLANQTEKMIKDTDGELIGFPESFAYEIADKIKESVIETITEDVGIGSYECWGRCGTDVQISTGISWQEAIIILMPEGHEFGDFLLEADQYQREQDGTKFELIVKAQKGNFYNLEWMVK